MEFNVYLNMKIWIFNQIANTVIAKRLFYIHAFTFIKQLTSGTGALACWEKLALS